MSSNDDEPVEAEQVEAQADPLPGLQGQINELGLRLEFLQQRLVRLTAACQGLIDHQHAAGGAVMVSADRLTDLLYGK